MVFVIIYAAGVCLFLPGTLLTALGAALFGPYRGFLYVWLGAMLGASFAFLIFTFFLGTIKDVWTGGRWVELLSLKVFLSLALFIFSFFIPKLLKMARASKQAGTA